MKESHGEGLARHTVPESCGGVREGAVEALTGAHTGQVLSREIPISRDADTLSLRGRQHGTAVVGKAEPGPARSQKRVHVWKLPAREPGDPAIAHR
jgi:RNA-directed DNA polymerase